MLTFLSPDSDPGEAGGAPQRPDAVFYRVPGLRPGDRARHTLQEPLRGSVPLCHLRRLVFHPVHPALLAAVRLLPEQAGECPGFWLQARCPG